MGRNCDLSPFDRGMIVGARRAGLSVSAAAELLGFARTTVSRVYTEWCRKHKTCSERQLCGRKCLVDERGRRRIARLVHADRKATVTQITARYNCGDQTSISERTARRTLRRMGYKKEPVQVVAANEHVRRKARDKNSFHDTHHRPTAVVMETERRYDDDHNSVEEQMESH